MWISVNTYIEKISAALEKRVIPEVSSDYARIQVYAAIELLKSLGKKIEYRRDLIREKTDRLSEVTRNICKAVLDKKGNLPEDLHEFFQKPETGQIRQDLLSIEESEAMLRKAIDCFFASRNQFEKADFIREEKSLREFLASTTIRDLVFVTSDDFFDREDRTRGEGREPGEAGS